MDESTRAAFRMIATGLWNLGMTIQVHLASIEVAEPGPVSKHQLARLLRDLEKQVDRLHSTLDRLGAGAGPTPDTKADPKQGPNPDSNPDFEPDETTQVRTDLPV